jgi:hypothetical protein
VLLLAYQTIVAVLFVGETRYRVPWDFLIALCAGAALTTAPSSLKLRRAFHQGTTG